MNVRGRTVSRLWAFISPCGAGGLGFPYPYGVGGAFGWCYAVMKQVGSGETAARTQIPSVVAVFGSAIEQEELRGMNLRYRLLFEKLIGPNEQHESILPI